MQVDGSGHCGQVGYRAELDPERVSLCNCTDCQMLTGSAFRISVPAPRDQFHLLRGELGCLTQGAELPPQKRIWCKSALGWVQDIGGIPAIERQ